MAPLPRTEGLTDVQREIVAAVRGFVDEHVLPVATELEHEDEYPTQIVDGLNRMGVFGLTIPEQYGRRGHSRRPADDHRATPARGVRPPLSLNAPRRSPTLARTPFRRTPLSPIMQTASCA